MGRIIDRVGIKVNKLTVIEFAGVKNNRSMWLCRCDCGNTKVTNWHDLKRGMVKSCGCLAKIHWDEINLAKKTHGLTHHPLFRVWSYIKQRCNNHNDTAYKHYGGRGITICPEWEHDFERFYNDVLPGYKKGLELDRIDNDKGYYKGNCRWVTGKQNKRNTSRNIYFKGVSLAEYCENNKLNYNTIHNRIYNCGWTIEKAVSEPVNIKHRRKERNHESH